jgi:hypothetical protein
MVNSDEHEFAEKTHMVRVNQGTWIDLAEVRLWLMRNCPAGELFEGFSTPWTASNVIDYLVGCWRAAHPQQAIPAQAVDVLPLARRKRGRKDAP